MQELRTALSRFVAGSIDLEQLCADFRTYVQCHPGERQAVAAWLSESVESGRLPDKLWTPLKRVIEAPVAAPRADGADCTIARAQAPAPAAVAPASAAAAAAPAARPAATPPAAPAWSAAPVASAARSAAPAASYARTGPGSTALPAAELRVGAVLKNRFTLVEELGAGGMGSVFKAHDRRKEEAQDRNPFIALKVLSEAFKRHPDSLIALQREARRAQTLAHPNVVTVYDFDRDGPHVYMTMEYLQGAPLDELLKMEYAGGLPMSRAWPIIRDVGRALEYGHQKGIVHSDLKPGNVFVCDDGTVKVLDFGISRPYARRDGPAEATLFDPAERLGGLTPAYAALEMWNRERPDPRDDIYALGCVAYELLTGHHPFARVSAKDAVESGLKPQRIESLSRRQWEALRQALAFRRADRTPTVRQFLECLEPPSIWKKYGAAIAVAALVVLGGAGLYGAQYYRTYVEDSLLGDMVSSVVPGQRTELTPEQRQEIADSLLLAEDFLGDADADVSPGELAYILTEGPNNVNQIADSVLAQDPGNRKARQLKSTIVRIYADRARELIQVGDLRGAYALIASGQRAVQNDRELFRLRRDICEEDARICTAAR